MKFPSQLNRKSSFNPLCSWQVQFWGVSSFNPLCSCQVQFWGVSSLNPLCSCQVQFWGVRSFNPLCSCQVQFWVVGSFNPLCWWQVQFWGVRSGGRGGGDLRVAAQRVQHHGQLPVPAGRRLRGVLLRLSGWGKRLRPPHGPLPGTQAHNARSWKKGWG
jgi:hypothetical protein